MGWEAGVTLAVLAGTLVVLARNLAGPDAALGGSAALLMALHVFSPRFPAPAAVAAGFGNEGLLTIAALFIVACGLTETGTVSVVTRHVLGHPRSVAGAQLRLMTSVAAFSAFLSNTAVVATYLPVVREWSQRTRHSVSKLYLPLSYAAVLGGTCTLVGTTTTLLVHGLMLETRASDPSVPVMGLFTIGAIGLPITLVGIAYVVATSRWLLPERREAHATFANPREYAIEMKVRPGSPIVGRTIEQAGLRHLPGAYLASIERHGEARVAVGRSEMLQGDDRLVFVGAVDSVVDLRAMPGLEPATDQVFKLNGHRHDRCLVEAVVSNTCPAAGQSVRDSRFRSRYDAAVIAIHRNGERLALKIGDVVLQPGDTLLLETHPNFLRHHRNSRDFFLTSPVENSHPRRHERAWMALAVLGALVAGTASGPWTGLSVFSAATIAAGLMLLTRCCSVEQARRSVDWSLLVTIGSALALGRAIETTGLASAVAHGVLTSLDGAGPFAVLAAVYGATLLCTELVTNNAAAALMFPISHAAAVAAGASFMPFALAVALAASLGFATPIGYQTHLMVYGPGGYRFSDFVRNGLPLDLLLMAVSVTLLPLVFPF